MAGGTQRPARHHPLDVRCRTSPHQARPPLPCGILNYLAGGLLGALVAVGLTVEKRDTTSWGYRWHGGALEGVFPTQAAAVEAGLRTRL